MDTIVGVMNESVESVPCDAGIIYLPETFGTSFPINTTKNRKVIGDA